MERLDVFFDLDEDAAVGALGRRGFGGPAVLSLQNAELLAGAFDGEALVMQQMLDEEQGFDIAAAIEAMA